MINILFLCLLPLFSFIYEESTLVFCQIPYFCTPFEQQYSFLGETVVFLVQTALYTQVLSGRGEIGRRTRLRIWRREAWGFESLRPHSHHFSRICRLVDRLLP